jgi:hypothetical protein
VILYVSTLVVFLDISKFVYSWSVAWDVIRPRFNSPLERRLILFREAGAVYCENHTEHTITLCGQNEEFLFIKPDGTYSYRFALQD